MAAVNPPQPPARLPIRNQFTNISSFQLVCMFFTFPDYISRRAVTIAWCRENGMLATQMTCPYCGDRCRERNRNMCIGGMAMHEQRVLKSYQHTKGEFFLIFAPRALADYRGVAHLSFQRHEGTGVLTGHRHARRLRVVKCGRRLKTVLQGCLREVFREQSRADRRTGHRG